MSAGGVLEAQAAINRDLLARVEALESLARDMYFALCFSVAGGKPVTAFYLEGVTGRLAALGIGV